MKVELDVVEQIVIMNTVDRNAGTINKQMQPEDQMQMQPTARKAERSPSEEGASYENVGIRKYKSWT